MNFARERRDGFIRNLCVIKCVMGLNGKHREEYFDVKKKFSLLEEEDTIHELN